MELKMKIDAKVKTVKDIAYEEFTIKKGTELKISAVDYEEIDYVLYGLEGEVEINGKLEKIDIFVYEDYFEVL